MGWYIVVRVGKFDFVAHEDAFANWLGWNDDGNLWKQCSRTKPKRFRSSVYFPVYLFIKLRIILKVSLMHIEKWMILLGRAIKSLLISSKPHNVFTIYE